MKLETISFLSLHIVQYIVNVNKKSDYITETERQLAYGGFHQINGVLSHLRIMNILNEVPEKYMIRTKYTNGFGTFKNYLT